VHVRTDCTDFLCPENCAQLLPRFLCQLMLYDSLEMRANTLRKHSCCPPRFLCTFNGVRPLEIRTVRPVLPCCLLPLNPCLLFSLGCMLSFCKCCLSSQARPLSCSLLFSQQECMNNPRMGAPPCPNRPHEGR
jgi:hypothetical protein